VHCAQHRSETASVYSHAATKPAYSRKHDVICETGSTLLIATPSGPQASAEKFAKFVRVVRTNRQTDRQTGDTLSHHNIPLPFRGGGADGVNIVAHLAL